nr:reverse transcriptase domain-containing protein [Tanacetum cinerariifolium]
MQAYDDTNNESPISLPRTPIAPPTILPPSSVSPKFDPQDFFLLKEILPPRKQAHFLSLPSTDLFAQPQAFEIGEDIQATRLDPIDRMAPKRTSTSATPAMNQAAIWQLIDDHVAAALEAQAANMANADNINKNPKLREVPVARKCSYKEFMSCQPFNFQGSEGVVGLIRWFKRTESVFSRSNCTEDCKKMEDEFYHLTVKGNDLKTYVRRFQELATLCPTMVSDSEKMMEAFIRGLPRSIKGNVTALKPQTLKEGINISHRLMD